MAKKVKVHIPDIIRQYHVNSLFRDVIADTVLEGERRGYISEGKVNNDEKLFDVFKELVDKRFSAHGEEVDEDCVDVPDEK